jgi:hypothetical protein
VLWKFANRKGITYACQCEIGGEFHIVTGDVSCSCDAVFAIDPEDALPAKPIAVLFNCPHLQIKMRDHRLSTEAIDQRKRGDGPYRCERFEYRRYFFSHNQIL